MKIYTKTGDAGETGLPGGRRVSKDATVTEVCGTVDELNTALGLVRSAKVPDDIDRLLDRIQSQLFDLGAEVARLGTETNSGCRIDTADVRAVEEAIDHFDTELPPLQNFLLPGGTFAAAELHFARAVCRRAERWLVHLMREVPGLSPDILIYLNRLSDLLFVLARLVNGRAGQAETIWRQHE
ncbi:MAG: cob(I)yrinic acid a,c-diamide adenosyltransferase [Planctomycetota bacterium]